MNEGVSYTRGRFTEAEEVDSSLELPGASGSALPHGILRGGRNSSEPQPVGHLRASLRLDSVLQCAGSMSCTPESPTHSLCFG